MALLPLFPIIFGGACTPHGLSLWFILPFPNHKAETDSKADVGWDLPACIRSSTIWPWSVEFLESLVITYIFTGKEEQTWEAVIFLWLLDFVTSWLRNCKEMSNEDTVFAPEISVVLHLELGFIFMVFATFPLKWVPRILSVPLFSSKSKYLLFLFDTVILALLYFFL